MTLLLLAALRRSSTQVLRANLSIPGPSNSMGDDELDLELLELLRQSLGISGKATDEVSSDTGVLRDAEFIYNNAIDVSIDMYGTRRAASSILTAMNERSYSMQSWSEHPLHPRISETFSEIDLVNFIFTMDLLNFSFWSEKSDSERFQVSYQDQRWTGYNSLVACLRRGIDEGIAVTNPRFWISARCTSEVFGNAFRSATDETMPLLQERIAILREAGQILEQDFGEAGSEEEAEQISENGIKTHSRRLPAEEKSGRLCTDGELGDIDGEAGEDSDGAQRTDGGNTSKGGTPAHAVASSSSTQQQAANGTTTLESHAQPSNQPQIPPAIRLPPDTSVIRLIEKAEHSAGKLVNLLTIHFPSFRDEAHFEGQKVRLLKRAQIFVADLWAAFQGEGYGSFDDIGHLTMFADYRVPQMLHALGVLTYSPPLENRIRMQQSLEAGQSWEVQLRGCSIWAVELIRREILRRQPGAEEATAAAKQVNAVLIDFLLYDLAKEREADVAAFAASGANSLKQAASQCFPTTAPGVSGTDTD